MHILSRRSLLVLLMLGVGLPVFAQQPSRTEIREAEYYQLESLPIPDDVVLEVGGLATLPDGRLAASTRRGEVYLIENPSMAGHTAPHFTRFAQGLHESLGVGYLDGDLIAAQRGELTRLRDTNGDGQADRYETLYSWPLDGNYHEYSYGPLFLPNGNMVVTLNLAWVGYGASLSKWRGWALEITPDGEMTPLATGMRSPAGFGLNMDGDLFYAENQGDWIGSGYITHVERGDFVGNPAGLRWTSEPGSPLDLKPADIPDTGEPLFEVAKAIPELKPPAVWFPHTLMGISTSAILPDSTGGAFGPFAGQLFVGDQGHSKVMRVFLEKVDGVYQGAVFPFREGFASGVLRLVWGHDDAMYVGMTSRGWDATGKAPYGLQRLAWTGKVPFEVKTMRAMPDGFELEFTRPVDPGTAANPASYAVTSFIYKYHSTYGSPAINQEAVAVRGVQVSEDGLRARLVLDGLREGYIHELKLPGVRSEENEALLHNVAYYTVNRIPEGERLDLASLPQQHAPQPSNVAPSEQTGQGSQPKRMTEMPPSWNTGPGVTITIGTEPGLRFNVEAIEVTAGSRVKLVFSNDDDMLHNFVVTMPDAADEVAEAAIALGLDGPEQNYIPASDNVLFHTALLQPETAEAIYFTVPDEPGDYTFVCTFPGHAMTMRGVFRVVPR
ncbi:MAG TPA: plastocyanin/azurin family copper-binding protein [Rhodothermales bacterium]|nr:plastocyanin/azurin family copper-binding protein [Rhodothermales bacterium]